MSIKTQSYKDLTIDHQSSILEALKRMDTIGRKLLIVEKNEKYYSLISIGDIQRAILNNLDLNSNLSSVVDTNKAIAKDSDRIEDIKETMLRIRCEYMPVLSSSGEVVRVIFWEDVFKKEDKRESAKINLPVVIMAGGKGSRLKPITNILPKPLIPIGERTIMECIMDGFVNSGCSTFHISVNYKAEMIKHYFETLDNPSYNLSYFHEPKPLGTAGSMHLIKDKIKSTFFVSNCDIIIDQDLSEIHKYHVDNKNMITIVSALKHHQIPYGTIETCKNGKLKSLVEKPEHTYQINAGLYILEPQCLEHIPQDTFFHITELIENLQKKGEPIGVFPVSEGSWTDIGQWDEYLKQIEE